MADFTKLSKVVHQRYNEIAKHELFVVDLFADVKKADVVNAIMDVVTANYEKNTIGVRLINTLIHQFFINGGLTQKEAKKVAFQKTLTLH